MYFGVSASDKFVSDDTSQIAYIISLLKGQALRSNRCSLARPVSPLLREPKISLLVDVCTMVRQGILGSIARSDQKREPVSGAGGSDGPNFTNQLSPLPSKIAPLCSTETISFPSPH
ncbi:hypothetical protein GOODEAATRI_031514 [Goodea atripinnis]|uniref:Uncharacterized protein n=1 Tax=Goodea atripinnis TaxID=208336 RepID=A0ABV0Q2N5_9TELE